MQSTRVLQAGVGIWATGWRQVLFFAADSSSEILVCMTFLYLLPIVGILSASLDPREA
ncbi:hypothetical protein TPL01_29000 [Sulfuriferula plumbiphila]|uniref:Uncharacterized protein n=1 Tax=Sulfuriferula plumbiphila TaxID=171865 RepID=A0A512LBF3_9PROT|nr:hypothetical protein SFPGR_18820 [Sulfuriferula plumbiphila]GEP31762.1 hypothetical protein TPL01_29000 [Sulfuriferula plumbiphila]